MNGSPSVKVALFIRNGGSESPCRWFYATEIYKLKREKEQLEKENIRLQKALNKKGKRLNFRHGYKNPRPHFCNRSTLTIHI